MSDEADTSLREHRRGASLASCAVLVLVGLWQASLAAPQRAAFERRADERVAAMVEGVSAVQAFQLAGRPEPSGRARTAFRLLAANGQLRGYVVPFEGPGFQRPLRGAVAVDPKRERILAVAVHESHESPAEDLFERHPWFLGQLSGTSCRAPVSLAPAPAEGAHAITGASISSHVLVRLVNESIAVLKAAPLREP